MLVYNFDTDKLFNYHWCGKFQSPSPEWTHLERRLHDFELMVVTEGILYIANESNQYKINKGQYILMGPTNRQYGYKTSKCSFYWLHFTYNGNFNNPELQLMESDSSRYVRGHLLIPEAGTLNSIERIIILMKQLQDSDKRYREVSLNNYLSSAVLAELANQSDVFKKYGEDHIKKQLYHDICDFIKLHLSSNITMDEIASYFGYNKKYLTTFFGKHSGISIKQYFILVKMDYAKAELSDTNKTIAQIAYDIGFHDVHHFSNTFKKYTGLSPTSYRNSYNKRFLFHT